MKIINLILCIFATPFLFVLGGILWIYSWTYDKVKGLLNEF